MAGRKLVAASLGLAICFSLGVPMPMAVQAAGPSVQSHRALYDLNLETARSSSNVVEANGVLEFEWDATCDGWTVSQKARIELAHDDGPGTSFGWIYNSWEAKDGSAFRFYVRRLFGSGRSEQIRGEARRKEGAAGGIIKFSMPEKREAALPDGVIFPTAHTLQLLGRLEAGELPFFSTVFDGATEDGLYGVSAVLVRDIAPGDAVPLDNAALVQEPSWRVNMAFFGVDTNAAEPEQEQGLRLFANGITDDLLFDYGEFALKATLNELTKLPDPDC